MARCKVYEIQGPDRSRTAGAARCHRDASREAKIDGKKYPICKKHSGVRWHLFKKDGWPYAVDLEADHP